MSKAITSFGMVTIEDFKRLRIKAGLPQQALADALNLDRSSISKIESGGRDLTIHEAVKWAERCGSSLCLLGSEHEIGVRSLGELSGSRLSLGVRLVRLLHFVEQAHVVTLEALVGTWEQVAVSTSEDAPKRQGIVKR